MVGVGVLACFLSGATFLTYWIEARQGIDRIVDKKLKADAYPNGGKWSDEDHYDVDDTGKHIEKKNKSVYRLRIAGLFTHYTELFEASFPEEIFSEYRAVRFMSYMSSHHPFVLAASKISAIRSDQNEIASDRFIVTSNLLFVIFEALTFATLSAIIVRLLVHNDGTCELFSAEDICVEAQPSLFANKNHCAWNIDRRYCYFDTLSIHLSDLVLYSLICVSIAVPVGHITSFLCHKLCSQFFYSIKVAHKKTLVDVVAQKKKEKNEYSKKKKAYEMNENEDVTDIESFDHRHKSAVKQISFRDTLGLQVALMLAARVTSMRDNIDFSKPITEHKYLQLTTVKTSRRFQGYIHSIKRSRISYIL